MNAGTRLGPPTTVLRGDGVETGLVGGKAAMLDRLVALGAPVPRSGAVTTAAYRAFVEQPELAELLERLRREPLPDTADMAAAQR